VHARAIGQHTHVIRQMRASIHRQVGQQ
jgi:hypothetical protein